MRWLVLVLAVSLLMFGCTGQTTTPGQTTTSGPSVLDLTGKKMAELVSLNIPVECEMTMKMESTEGSSTANVKMFMKGSNFREDITVQGKSISVIMKDKVLYSSNPQKGEAALGDFGDCDWLMFDTTKEPFKSSETDVSESFDPTKLDVDNKLAYTCKQASFGDEKFSASGKVCDMAVFYQQMGVTE